MQKFLVCFLLFFLTTIARGQTHTTVYGVIDTGLVRQTGTGWEMGSYHDSRLGFKGTEDLGNGVKATFELEKRFNLNDGTNADEENFSDITRVSVDTAGKTTEISYRNIDWRGAANVGLSGNWGAVRLGRMKNLTVETYHGLDPFHQHGIAASFAGNDLLYAEQLGNTVRYDSAELKGFRFGASYTLGHDSTRENETGDYYRRTGNDGFALSTVYKTHSVNLVANYARMVDSGKSDVFNLGGAYVFEKWRISAGYQGSVTRLFEKLDGFRVEQKAWFAGLEYRLGNGTVKASYNRARLKMGSEKGNANKYALGYIYRMSKTISLYAFATYTDSDNELIGSIYNSNHAARDSVTGIQTGISYRF